mgnify:CR=1 FL=1
MSSTIAEIVARPHRDVGYVLFIEGLPFAFTNRSELAGSGVGSWISGAPGGDRVVIEGLTVPETISYATSLEDGMLSSEDGASFQLTDFEGKLIALVAEDEGDIVGETFGPKTDPAPALLLDGVTPVWGRWLNHEAIGPAGERRYYPCMPVDLPGYDHAAVTGEAQTLALSVLRDAPTWHEGVRCALYVIYFDTTSNYIPNWITHHNSGYSLVWFGSTRELTCEALTWTLDCDGPTSWLRKQGRYRQLIEQTLDRYNLPRFLLYVSMIESGYDPHDRSHKGAVGLWQFLPEGARIYGLRVDYWVDERQDPVRSTDAAARYLGDLKARFGSWHLTLAAFNAGYGAVLRAMQKYNTNDYWELCRHEDGLPWETLLYVPKAIATALVGDADAVPRRVDADDLRSLARGVHQRGAAHGAQAHDEDVRRVRAHGASSSAGARRARLACS